MNRTIAVAIAGIVLGAAGITLAQQAAAPPSEDVVVLARAFKKVRITFAARGSHLQRCDVTLSSGVALVDRMMCSLLRSCLEGGATGERRAKACLDDRVARFDMVPADGADPFAVALQLGWMRQANVAALEEGSPSAAPPVDENVSDVSADERLGDVVVKARRSPIRAGLWEFTEVQWAKTTSRGDLPPTGRRWRRCIPADFTERGLIREVEGPPPYAGRNHPMPHACRWQTTLKSGEIEGGSRCFVFGGRRTTKMTGQVTGTSIQVSKVWDARMPRRAAGSSDPDTSRRGPWRVWGEFSGVWKGACSR